MRTALSRMMYRTRPAPAKPRVARTSRGSVVRPFVVTFDSRMRGYPRGSRTAWYMPAEGRLEDVKPDVPDGRASQDRAPRPRPAAPAARSDHEGKRRDRDH